MNTAQNAQNNFFGKNLKFLKTFFVRKMLHSAEKCERGALLDLLTYNLLQNIKKLEGRCHSPLPVWDVAANAWESGADTVAACDSPGGTLMVIFKH